MLSAHEKLKLMKMQNAIAEKESKLSGYRDIVPEWMMNAARRGLRQLGADIKDYEDRGDSSVFLWIGLGPCTIRDDPLATIPKDWNVGDSREYMAMIRRDMRDDLKRRNWRRVAAHAMRLDAFEAAIIAKKATKMAKSAQ